MIKWHTRLAFGVRRSRCDGFPAAPAEADGVAREGSASYWARRLQRERERRQRQEGCRFTSATGEVCRSAGRLKGGASCDGPVRVVRRTHHAGSSWPDPEVVLGDVPASGVGADAGRGERPLRCRGPRAPDRDPGGAHADSAGLAAGARRAHRLARGRQALRPRPRCAGDGRGHLIGSAPAPAVAPAIAGPCPTHFGVPGAQAAR